MDIKDRVKELMEYEQMTAAAFAESIGVSQATISHTLGDRNKNPSTDFIMRLHHRYKYVNLNWLLTGEGKMIIEGAEPPAEKPAPSLFSDELAFEKNHESTVKARLNSGETEETDLSSDEKMNIKYSENKRITEIRVFFDDNTYEIFKPEK